MRRYWRYWVLRSLFEVLVIVFLRSRRHLEVRGLENLPAEGAFILVGNHVATVDPPLVGSRVRRLDVHYMAKAESFGGRARFLFEGWNAFPVVRRSADRRAIAHALRVLADGHVLVIYPEGTRSADARLGRAFPGVGMIARVSGAPVVCAAIWGSEHVLPRGRTWPRSAPIQIRFSEPAVVPARTQTGRRLPSQEASDVIMRRLAALLPQNYRGVYSGAGLDDGGAANDGLPEQQPPAA